MTSHILPIHARAKLALGVLIDRAIWRLAERRHLATPDPELTPPIATDAQLEVWADMLPPELARLPDGQRTSIMRASDLLGAVSDQLLDGRAVPVDPNGWVAVARDGFVWQTPEVCAAFDWGTQS